MASCCCSPLGTGSGGGDFAPIQQVRYLDPQFAGATSTGSIAQPFTEFSEFFAVMTGPFGWAVWLPAGGPEITPDAPVPPFRSVAFLGVDRRQTVLLELTAGEADSESWLTFSNLNLVLLTLDAGEHNLHFASCRVGEIAAGGAVTGQCFLVDCIATSLALGPDIPLDFAGGTLDSGTTSFATGRFANVQILTGANLVPNGTTNFIGCSFGTGVTISNAATPTLVMDAFSYASFVESGVTFAGTVIVAGQLRGVTGIPSVAVPAQSTATEDFAAPGLTAQHRVLVNVNNNMNAGLGIVGVWPLPGGDSFRVTFMNATAAVINPAGFSLTYVATL